MAETLTNNRLIPFTVLNNQTRDASRTGNVFPIKHGISSSFPDKLSESAPPNTMTTEVTITYTTKTTLPSYNIPKETLQQIVNNASFDELKEMFIHLEETFHIVWSSLNISPLEDLLRGWEKTMVEKASGPKLNISPSLQKAYEEQQAKYILMSKEQIKKELDGAFDFPYISPEEERDLYED